MTVAAALGIGATPASAAPLRPAHHGAVLTHLATFGTLGSGSTVGPDAALYVADGVTGAVDRIDPRTGAVTAYATGLPPKVLDIGGAMDVAFLHGRLYALVTLVGGDIVGGPHLGDATVGVYRLERDGSWSVTADIGAWSVAHPPTTDYFITTGVQYAMAAYGNGFLVTDGHHNRVLQVGLDGSIRARVTVGDVVPTGLETDGRRIWFTEAGPVPHDPATGRVLSLSRGGHADVVATGARLAVDVEQGPCGRLYVLSQGTWDGAAEGTPALTDTGHLYAVGHGGRLAAVRNEHGRALVLDRPTSVEIVGTTAYVVSLSGDVYRVRHL